MKPVESDSTNNIINCCLVGTYVYSFVEKETGGIDITGDPDVFYLTLGSIIQEYYPDVFDTIVYNQ